MEPVVTKLNQVAASTIKKSDLAKAPSSSPKIDFQSQFDKTLTDRLLEKLHEDSHPKNNVTVLSANDVRVEVGKSELGDKKGAGEKYFDMFKSMNKDLVSLDATIETLSMPGVSIHPRQLLTVQAGIANMSILAEGFSRFTDSIGRGIQTIVQTQV